MVRHSAIVARRGDDREAAPDVSFSGRDLEGLRADPDPSATRSPFAERLPPGAAAVLINRGHTDTDLYLPIDEQFRARLRRD